MYATLFKRVDAASLAVFRMGFGAILLFECINYGVFLCIECMYHSSTMLFKYHHFEWATALSTTGLRVVWLAMAVAAFCVMIGFYYRLSLLLFTIGFTYQFLLDQALYLNHFYMVILFCVLMLFVPAHCYWSVDANRNRSLYSPLVPNWTRWLLGAQLEIILIAAGLVKINHDWLNLEPLRMWLTARSDQHGIILQTLTSDIGIAIASYGVIALHLVGAPLLLWKKTRRFALFAYAVFHTINAFVFNIGIFPWFTLFASLLLFDPDWPRQFWAELRTAFPRLRARFPTESLRPVTELAPRPASPLSMVIIALITVWLVSQIVIPVRHVWMPGNVAWNEAGHRFGWRMKLRSKRGVATFRVDTDQGSFTENPKDDLNFRQWRKMTCIPDLLWQYAQHLETRYAENGHGAIRVFVDTNCSLNGRDPQPLIKNDVDLLTINRDTTPTRWITELTQPLKNPYLNW